MMSDQLSKIYFSATSTTARCVDAVASAIGIAPGITINLADHQLDDMPAFMQNDAVIFASPVYGGRIPDLAAQKLKGIKGNGARAIAMVVYGNRDYDDALLELTDILVGNGFKIVAAAAFIGQHSIFPKVATARPDESDLQKLAEFGRLCRNVLEKASFPELNIKGGRPYKKYGGVPVRPAGNQSRCKACGRCVELCPAMAIDMASLWISDAAKCISCGRCIQVCPHQARKYKGLKYSLIAGIFKAIFSSRKEPDIML